MEEINEIKLPKGVNRISVKQHDNKIAIEFIPEKRKFKAGDFVYEDGRIMIVKSYPNFYHANIWYKYSDKSVYDGKYSLAFSEPTFRYATDEEKQLLIDAMEKEGKRWNAEKLIVEDIPLCKFKAGDKVRIKDGISSNSQGVVYPYFAGFLDQYIGNVMTVKEYVTTCLGGYITTSEAKREDHHFGFAEDWLELCLEKQQPKFKAGDKVKIKDGISSKTHSKISPAFLEEMDKLIGTTMTVSGYTPENGYVVCNESGWRFLEEWLEPWSEEPKKGDLAIFWDDYKDAAIIKIYDRKEYNYHCDSFDIHWDNAIKFESKEQFEKVLRGEI